MALAAMATHRALRLAILFPPPNRLTLVMTMFAARQGQLDLGATTQEIDGERNEGQALLCDSPVEPINLASMKKELSASLRIRGIGSRGGLVGRDMQFLEPRFSAMNG